MLAAHPADVDRAMPAVLITRPEPEAHETASRVSALGFEPVLAPALAIARRRLALRPGLSCQAVLVTSGAALPSLPAALQATPLLAVGDATAARARAAGFRRVSSAGRDASALADLAAKAHKPGDGPLLLVCGEGHARTLAADLRARGFRVIRRVVYATCPQADLPEAAWAALDRGRVRAALFFSAGTVDSFVRALDRRAGRGALARVTALAISDSTAAALAALPWAGIRVAPHPTQDDLLACLT